MTRAAALALSICLCACAAPRPHVAVGVLPVAAPASAPAAVADAPLEARVVGALVAAARGADTLPEQVEVEVGGVRYTCYRWPLRELLAGRITPATLWSVYVIARHPAGQRHSFEVQ